MAADLQKDALSLARGSREESGRPRRRACRRLMMGGEDWRLGNAAAKGNAN